MNLVVLIGLAIVLVPLSASSIGWFLARRASHGKRWMTSLLLGILPIVIPASDIVRQEYVPGDPDVLWAFAFVLILALGASAISLAIREKPNLGNVH